MSLYIGNIDIIYVYVSAIKFEETFLSDPNILYLANVLVF